MTEEEIEATKKEYSNIYNLLFFPDNSVSKDIINYFATLLRIVGMEDKGWDPHMESRVVLEDMNSIMQMDLPAENFTDQNLTKWRISLLMYSHMVEMDALYEVITNLLRFKLGAGYSPNPFFMFLNNKQKKLFQKSGIYPKQKIEIINKLSSKAGIPLGYIFDDFYRSDLRNAINHSDFIITDDEFRCRNGNGAYGAFSISLEKLNVIITKAQIFISSFFRFETAARKSWGELKHTAFPYDPTYKGLMEVLVNDDDLMCGFKVHWPNNTESVYRRTDNGIDMINCSLDIKNATIDLWVGLYAQQPGQWGPLVEKGSLPQYTKLENGLIPEWKTT